MYRRRAFFPHKFFGIILRNRPEGGATNIKKCVKLACKQFFMFVATSDGHPMLLVQPVAVQEDTARTDQYISAFLHKEAGTYEKHTGTTFYKKLKAFPFGIYIYGGYIRDPCADYDGKRNLY